MPLHVRPKKVTRERIEWSAWSAPVILAEPESDDSNATWGVCMPPSRAFELGLTQEEGRRDYYLLSSGLSRRDAEAFVKVFGPMLEDHFYPKYAEERRARDGR